MPIYDSIAIVGVGLIGGSIGLAVRRNGLANDVVGVGRRESSLRAALEVGAIHTGTTNLAEGVRNAQLVVVCAPVDSISELVREVAVTCSENTLITDAGSTKQKIVGEIAQLSSQNERKLRFVGSHPMAGDHRTGPAHARAGLFDGKVVVTTPTATTDDEDLAETNVFWKSLGASVLTMSPAEHDQSVAFTSHLPHLVAYALAQTTPESAGPLAATGWQDTTRVASADPLMWQQIFLSNRESLLSVLDDFQVNLSKLRDEIASDHPQKLTQLLQEAKRIRDALGN